MLDFIGAERQMFTFVPQSTDICRSADGRGEGCVMVIAEDTDTTHGSFFVFVCMCVCVFCLFFWEGGGGGGASCL